MSDGYEKAEDEWMKEETKRCAEMRQVLEEYKASGLSRRAFCEQRGMALATLDYWVIEQERKATKPAPGRCAKLVKVEFEHSVNTSARRGRACQ